MPTRAARAFLHDYYLGGPMSTIADFNFPAFNDTAKRLRADNFTVFNPAETDGGDATKPYSYYMDLDIKAVQAATKGMIVLPGWEESTGANVEVAICVALGKEVLAFEEVPDRLPGEYRLRPLYDANAGPVALRNHLYWALRPEESIPKSSSPWDAEDSVLVVAEGLINGPRRGAYDHPIKNFGRIVRLWNALLHEKLRPGALITEEEHALMMQQVKQARLLATPDHHDSVADIAGYDGTYEMLIKWRRENPGVDPFAEAEAG